MTENFNYTRNSEDIPYPSNGYVSPSISTTSPQFTAPVFIPTDPSIVRDQPQTHRSARSYRSSRGYQKRSKEQAFSQKTMGWLTAIIVGVMMGVAILWGTVAYINNQNLIEERSTYNNAAFQYSLSKEDWSFLQQKALSLLSSTQVKDSSSPVWNNLQKTATFNPPHIDPATRNTIKSFKKGAIAYNDGISTVNKRINTINSEMNKLSNV